MVAFAIGQAEQPLLEDRVLAVPQGQSKAEPLLIVGNAGEAILTPMRCARPRMIVREVIPGVAVFALVLADRAPLSFAEVGPHFFHGKPSVRASSRRICSAFIGHASFVKTASQTCIHSG